jgi:hypothetical protein
LAITEKATGFGLLSLKNTLLQEAFLSSIYTVGTSQLIDKPFAIVPLASSLEEGSAPASPSCLSI